MRPPVKNERSRRQDRGQGLAEFALVLPLLLLVIMGIADFGRALLIYTNVFNAAREGARHGAVDPWDMTEVHSSFVSKLNLVDPNAVDLSICCDTGPGTSTFYCNQNDTVSWSCGSGSGSGENGKAWLGDRVVISSTYVLEPITPLMLRIAPELNIQTRSARTIASVGQAYTPPQPPGSTTSEVCDNGQDDDSDGLADCDDPDCSTAPVCQSGSISISASAEPETVHSGEEVLFTYTITNTGESTLSNVTIEDAFGNTFTIDSLAAGSSATRTATQAINTTTTNDVTAAGADPGGTTVSGSDSVEVTVIGPSLDLGVDVDPERVYRGETVTFTYRVTNTGDTDLYNVTVTDSYGTPISPITLTAGSPSVFWTVRRTLEGDTVNTVTATANDALDSTVSDSEEVQAYIKYHPIVINEPLNVGTVVTGTAEPGMTVYIRDLMDESFPNDSATVMADGSYMFTGLPELEPNHVIAVEGYGEWDTAVVVGDFDSITIQEPLCHGSYQIEGKAEPGQTLSLIIAGVGYEDRAKADITGNYTFTLPAGQPLQSGQTIGVSGYGENTTAQVEACTTDAYLVINPQCGSAGSVTINVEGYNWGKNDQVDICWDNDCGYRRKADQSGHFSYDMTVDVTEGLHTITAEGSGGLATSGFLSPCPRPNLVVSELELLDTQPISSYQTLYFRALVSNIGTKPINNLFWVDLHSADPTQDTDSSIAWAAVSSLDADASQPLTITLQYGFPTTGTHQVWAYADSWEQVRENNEFDNTAGPETVEVTLEGEAPVPPSGNSSLLGETWVSISGVPVPQERARVWCRNQDGDVYGPVYSAEDATYELADLPGGTYTVMADTWIDGTRYFGSVSEVQLGTGDSEVVVVILYQG